MSSELRPTWIAFPGLPLPAGNAHLLASLSLAFDANATLPSAGTHVGLGGQAVNRQINCASVAWGLEREVAMSPRLHSIYACRPGFPRIAAKQGVRQIIEEGRKEEE